MFFLLFHDGHEWGSSPMDIARTRSPTGPTRVGSRPTTLRPPDRRVEGGRSVGSVG